MAVNNLGHHLPKVRDDHSAEVTRDNEKVTECVLYADLSIYEQKNISVISVLYIVSLWSRCNSHIIPPAFSLLGRRVLSAATEPKSTSVPRLQK